MKMNIVLFAVVFACAMLYAESSDAYPPGAGGTVMLELTKSAQPTAALGDTITVTIEVKNKGSSAVSALVEESLGNVDPVSPQPKYANISGDVYAAFPPYLSWDVNLTAGGSTTLTYKIKPKTVGPLSIGPTRAYAGGRAFSSNSVMIQVACSSAPTCDESIGETPLTCPAKCAAANATGETAPNFTPQPVPSAPVTVPDAQAKLAEVSAEEKKYEDEKNNWLLMIGAGVVIVILAIAGYFMLIRKKARKY